MKIWISTLICCSKFINQLSLSLQSNASSRMNNTGNNAIIDYEPIDYISLQFERISDSIECIREFLSDILTQQQIFIIYSRAAYKYNVSPEMCEKYLPQHIDTSKKLPTAILKVETEEEIKATEERKKKEDIIVVKAFCDSDYGYTYLQKYIQQNCQDIIIKQNQYNSIIYRVIGKAYQQLEDYLHFNGVALSLTTNQERQIIIERMVHCRRMLAPEICQVMLKIIRNMHVIGSKETVSKDEANILYKTLRRIAQASVFEPKYIQMKPKQKYFEYKRQYGSDFSMAIKERNVDQRSRRKKEFKYQIHEIWTPFHQQFLLQLYKQTPYLSMIRDRFKQMFCEDANLFTVQSLKSVLYRILRTAIKKLQATIKQKQVDSFSPMTTLDDNRIKMIIYNHNFREVRLLILEVYSQELSLPLLVKTINKINLAISQSKNNYSTKKNKREYEEARKKVKKLCQAFQITKNDNGRYFYGHHKNWSSPHALSMNIFDTENVRDSDSNLEKSDFKHHEDNQSFYQGIIE